MLVQIEVTDPNLSGTPGLARENIAKDIGWDAMRELFPRAS